MTPLQGTDLVLGGSVENLGDLHILVYTKISQQVFYHCSIKSGSTTKRRVRDYLVSVPKTELVGETALIEANQVLDSPLTVSTRRLELTTSKATVSKKVLVLAKSRSKYGAKT